MKAYKRDNIYKNQLSIMQIPEPFVVAIETAADVEKQIARERREEMCIYMIYV